MKIQEEWKEQGFRDLHIYFKSDKGKISLVRFKGDLFIDAPYEIYCLEGELFTDVERFETLIQAMNKIKGLL